MQLSHLLKGSKTGKIRLSLCENPFPPLKEVISEAKKELKKANRYGSKYADMLRDELSSFLKIPKENIFVNAGSELILRQIFSLYGKRALLYAPSYVLFEEISENKKFIFLDKKDGFSFITDIKIPKGTTIFPIVNPNNPTGRIFPIDVLEEWTKKHKDVLFLVDEAYIDFAGKTALDIFLERKNVIITRTFSKAFSLAGLRVGYAIMPKKMAEFFRKNNDPYPISRVAEKAAVISLKNYKKIKQRVRKLLQYRAWLQRKLSNLGLKVYPSSTHFFLVEMPNAKEFSLRLSEKGIYVLALKQKGLGKNFLRFVAALPKENKIIVKAVKEALEEI